MCRVEEMTATVHWVRTWRRRVARCRLVGVVAGGVLNRAAAPPASPWWLPHPLACAAACSAGLGDVWSGQLVFVNDVPSPRLYEP